MAYWGGMRRRGYGWQGSGVEMPSIPPPEPGVTRVVIASEGKGGLNDVVAYRFARAAFMVVIDVKDGQVVNTAVYENPLSTAGRGAGAALSQWLISIGAKVVIGPRFGPNVAAILGQAGIRMEMVPPGIRIADALRRLGITR